MVTFFKRPIFILLNHASFARSLFVITFRFYDLTYIFDNEFEFTIVYVFDRLEHQSTYDSEH